MSSAASSFRLPGFAALPRRPGHICVTKDGTEVDSVTLTDKALLFGRKVNAPPAVVPPPRPPSQLAAGHSFAVTNTWLYTYLQVKHAPKLGTYRLDHMSVSQEHAPPAGQTTP